MFDVPGDRYYSKDGMWAQRLGDTAVRVGLTAYWLVTNAYHPPYREISLYRTTDAKGIANFGIEPTDPLAEVWGWSEFAWIVLWSPVSAKTATYNSEEGSNSPSGAPALDDAYGQGWMCEVEYAASLPGHDEPYPSIEEQFAALLARGALIEAHAYRTHIRAIANDADTRE
ncbi:hypothetical protein IU433_22035 [Nocardia puris]|uniref:hypothetical protein n=1 Tax=Nocardia TaxID=1817 RepID=UPI0004A710AE|nr:MULTISPECIES: hypothetical protein [Nocardia]MBF6137202.1 hypothetical protein [Nocardia otitidiscaviarum]MBF6181806.1 hypothetical protein [Nocardia otitidiscaviarum]MBF6461699.1 hypothetical protein [Nocardia puris]MBF6488100.1 hypothetical protein [Nocardia otitidiscaviarum]